MTTEELDHALRTITRLSYLHHMKGVMTLDEFRKQIAAVLKNLGKDDEKNG
jgi:hypothetical protein